MTIYDTHTLLFIFATIKLLQGFLLSLLDSRIPYRKGINLWVYGSFITGAGLLIYALSPYLITSTTGFVCFLLHNLFIMLGDCLFLAGIQKFIGNPIKKSMLFGLLVLTVINVIAFSSILHIAWMYLFVNTILTFALYSIVVVEAKRKLQELLQFTHIWRLTIYFLGSYAVFSLLVAVFYLISKPTNPMEDSSVMSLLIILTTICTILLMYGLVLIVMSSLNDKLTEEIEFKNRLYSVIANDLQNPFETFENHVGVFKQSHNLWNRDQIKSWIYDMENVSLDSSFLVESLLNWCECQLKQNRISFCEQNIKDVIDTAITHVQHLAVHKNIQIQAPEHSETKACFDTDMIEIVIKNLCANIIQSTASNGIIQITTGCKTDKIGIIISNKDIGIDAEELDKLFEVKKTDSSVGFNSGRLSGFGLLICKEFVELNGGKIMTRSISEAGNYFAFTLPLLSS